MKYLIVLIALGAAGYAVYNSRLDGQNPEIIESPIYAELRTDMQIEGREINMVLFGEMADEQDCQQRSARVWSKLIPECKECTMTLSSCNADLEPRYARLFDDIAIHSTYLSFDRGNRFERNGRMVVYGLTADEGDFVCGTIKSQFAKHYEGTVSCVPARRD
ncbi:hypothetical protein JM946_27600 [Steroidobacter sp. S1-65]|uniref:Uncharacterized protein n=1 Tax=Steroidobacter gossypii TaxID=2805490 RepID=A0ABS1X5L1_9GAMM|nr:hypothetical protein [Steroidobacter gossypii]MBM0108515.1 hypothetical protein [Steroidobacter gossypii]